MAKEAFQGFSPDSLAGKPIIMLRNSPRVNCLEATYPDSRILAVDKEPVICLKLATGWCDIASDSSIVSGEVFLKHPSGQGFAKVSDTPTLTDRMDGGVGIAMRKGDVALRSRVNEALATINQDGSYAKMLSPYFDFDVTPPRECR